MMKRIASLLFVLTLAGSVWAGICDCLEGSDHPESKCCKRERSERSSVSKKPCCSSECGQSALANVHRTQSDATVKIPLPTSLDDSDTFLFGSVDLRSLALPRPKNPAIDHRPNFARPPNLYLIHSSFLI